MCFRPQFSSVAQSYPILCHPMDYSTPGLPVHHHLPEFTQTHVHQIGDATQPSHPLSSPSSPTFNPSIRVFSNKSVLHIGWPKYWSFSFSIRGSHWMMVTWGVNWPDLGSAKISWQLMDCGQVLHYMILSTSASTALLALLVYIQDNTVKGGWMRA